MKSHRQVLTLHLPDRCGFVNITDEVKRAVAASGVKEGLCLVNSMHKGPASKAQVLGRTRQMPRPIGGTSSVFINDEESGLKQDYLRWLEKLAPFNPGSDPTKGGYLHTRTGEDNGDAHHRGSASGSAERSREHAP